MKTVDNTTLDQVIELECKAAGLIERIIEGGSEIYSESELSEMRKQSEKYYAQAHELHLAYVRHMKGI